MSDENADPTVLSKVPPYEDNGTARFVYFDIVGAMGTMNGAVQIELGSRILIPVAGSNEVRVKFITTGHLRCSPTAAIGLREAINSALNMLEQPQQQPAAAASTLN